MPLTPDSSLEQKTFALDSHDEDYEVITSEDVDAVLEQLDQLSAATQSENIRAILEEAADSIYSLVYDDSEELEEDQQEAA